MAPGEKDASARRDIWRDALHGAAGWSVAGWARLVHATSRIVTEPADLMVPIRAEYPFIMAMWHGQQMLVPFFQRPGYEGRVLVSRSGDGAVVASAVTRLGLGVIRGSGGRRERQHEKGGPAALRAMVGALKKDGVCVALTADVPRVGGVVGPGIVALARLSGRPIVPVAVASSRMVQLDNWDRMAVNLPFSRLAFVMGEPVRVPAGADAGVLEAKRLEVQRGLDGIHQRAYALVGRRFPRGWT